MIAFDFDYYRAATVDEALDKFIGLKDAGKKPLYYAGGTEIISRARAGDICFDSVVDIKEIPECNTLEFEDGKLVIGAAVTLSEITESKMFPLLTEVCRAVADHTARDMITVGGNICGHIPYREAVLPFLAADSRITIAGRDGMRVLPINDAFDRSLQLGEGEILIDISTEKCYTEVPFFNRKRTKYGRADYPLATVAALCRDKRLNLALSGVCAYPFRFGVMEDFLNDGKASLGEKACNATGCLPDNIIADIQGSADYRETVLENLLVDALKALEGVM
jgi:CO/xanthine dehydrogenase FAD-binding subunit